MKEVKLLVGDYEYAKIEELFEKEADFEPKTEMDEILVTTIRAIVSPNNLMAEDVGGPETANTTFHKLEQPEDSSLEGNVDFSDIIPD